MSKDATKCDQEELRQLFWGVSEMKYIFLLFLSHGFKSQAAHRGPGQGKSMCYSRLKGCFFSNDRLIR